MQTKKLSRDERIAAMRKFRFTWHNASQEDECWAIYHGGWVPGNIILLGRKNVGVRATSKTGATVTFDRPYAALRGRSAVEFNGDDVPLDAPEALAHV